MFWNWFRSGNLTVFAKDLVNDFVQHYPPSLEGDERPANKKRLASALLGMDRKIAEFCSQNTMGVFRKAKLANGVKWGLRERGYTEKFVDNLTKHVVVRLSGR